MRHQCNLAAKGSGLEGACVLCTSHREQQTLLSEHVYCVAITFKMTEQVEQRICIKFCIKLEHSFTETTRLIQKAFTDDAMSAAQIKVWHKCFKDGWESVERDPCSGRPATSTTPENAECWSTKIRNGQSRTRSSSGDSKYCVLDFDAGSWHETCCGKILQPLLPEQKEHRAAIANIWFKSLPINQISSRRS